MKTPLLALALAATFAAGGALAQTTATPPTGGDTGATAFGADWSTSLRTAVFSDEGGTVRPDSELASQFATLSDEDKDVLRRDCMAHGRAEGDAGAAPATQDAAPTAAGPGADVSPAQMAEICEAAADL